MNNFDDICKALDYIDSHLTDPINLERLANTFYFSPYYFHHIFSEITGKPIAAHIRDRRLEVSCVQLASTDKTILEIGLDSGSVRCRRFAELSKANTDLRLTSAASKNIFQELCR